MVEIVQNCNEHEEGRQSRIIIVD